MKKIKIESPSKPHFCYFGTDLFEKLPKLISASQLPKNILVIVDSNVNKLWGKNIRETFSSLTYNVNYYILEAGEKSKSFTKVQTILKKMVELKFNRDSMIISIGGGVCGDLSGFVASIYNRGIALVHVPTTLLSMIDSSIGGKNGINFANRKNNIGCITQPEFILIDKKFLKTLPKDEFLSGCGELLKYAFLGDKSLFKDISKFAQNGFKENDANLDNLIYKCILVKSSVVKQDEGESDVRKVLNLGHTFAHGIESTSNFKIAHGIAVSAGLLAAIILSYKIGLINEKQLSAFSELPLLMKYPESINKLSVPSAIKYMASDKKSVNASPQFVLINDIGELAMNVEVDSALVNESLTSALNFIKTLNNPTKTTSRKK